MRPREEDLTQLKGRLQGWLQARMPEARGLKVSGLKRPSAGLSNETFVMSLAYEGAGAGLPEKLVFRLAPTGFQVFPDYDLPKQHRIMSALAATEVPVPKMRWLEEDESVLGRAFYVMDFVDGELPSEVPPYHAFGMCLEASPERRARLWWSGLETLALIHALDWRVLGLDFVGVPAPGTGAVIEPVEAYERFMRWGLAGQEQPILEAALRWLKDNAYQPRHVALNWGDARLPNLIFRDDTVAAVLDWEMAFLGDPEADLAWWLFLDWQGCDGYGIPRLEGFPSREETIRRYEELTCKRVEHLHYQEVFAAFRFGVVMARIAA
ncbi:MAG TPA: phosphotransferase family protein, partial [Dehalococcoidia bacterium]|nr:phosphotransferase family protein [Dehalococcoidia bacterium]